MELLKQLCDPGLAKQLWKKGVRLDTFFFYFIHQDGQKKGEINYDINIDLLFNEKKDWFAPTAVELGEIIPWEISWDDGILHYLNISRNNENNFSANYMSYRSVSTFLTEGIVAKKESDLRAKLILELIKQKYIKVTPTGDLEPIEKVEA